MSSITDLLAAILAAKKGEEVRGSIHDAIELCYQDGKAGVNDLQARQLIEAVAEVNEQQAAAIEVLQARVEELESGEGGSSQQSTTIDIPTVLVDGGVVENVSVNNNSTKTQHVTFTTEFTEIPKVMVAIGKNVGAVSQYGYLSANILYPSVTTTGFDFFLANRTGSDRSPGVVWYAYQPTVETIDLDITIPETEGMTEAQVRGITGPISAAVDAIKTGYDGTTYQTAAEAVRTQINDLHVLIGDEPGTAIDSDSIGYGEGSVEDALDELNERLEELEQGGTGGLTADVKAALLACFENVAWANANGQTYYDALEAALYPPANLTSISAVYTQSGTVYDSDSLYDLKSDLVVTAHYSDSTSETVSAYTLSGTLTVGTCTITVGFGGKTTTFTVTVTADIGNLLYDWDFTQSLIDSVGNKEVTLDHTTIGSSAPTRTSAGIVFDDANQICHVGDFGSGYFIGKTIEVDVANFSAALGASSQHYRLIMLPPSSTKGAGPLIYKNGEGWAAYAGSSWSNVYGNAVSGTDTSALNYFSGKTVKIVFDSNGYPSLYVNGTLIGTASLAFTGTSAANLYIGGISGNASYCYDMTISGLRIYEGAA